MKCRKTAGSFTVGGHTFDVGRRGDDCASAATLDEAAACVTALNASPGADRAAADVKGWGATPSALDELTSASDYQAANRRNAHTTRGGTMSGQDLLMNSSFSFNLTDSRGEVGPWRVWAQGATESFNGLADKGFDVDGDVSGGYFGMDFRAGETTRFGLAVGQTDGEIEYDNSSGAGGEWEIDLASVMPYFHWTPRDDLGVWGMLGFGSGDAEYLDDDGGMPEDPDVSMRMIGFGVRGAFSGPWQGGVESTWKASAFAVEMDYDDGVADVESGDVTSHRLRFALEGRMPGEVSENGGRLTPSWEVGLRLDDGDAEAANGGADVGLGLDYSNPNSGLRIRARGRYLAATSEEDFDEWSASLSAQFDPGVQGRGVTFSMDPVWKADGMRNRIGVDFSNALGVWGEKGLRLKLIGEHRGAGLGDGRIEVRGGIDF